MFLLLCIERNVSEGGGIPLIKELADTISTKLNFISVRTQDSEARRMLEKFSLTNVLSSNVRPQQIYYHSFETVEVYSFY